MPARRGRRGGRRVQRGRHASIRQTDNPYLAVEQALTPAAREALVLTFTRLNPHYTGAHAADILDALDDSDSYLEIIEPYWDRHGEQLSRQLNEAWRVISPAAIAGVLLLGLHPIVGVFHDSADLEQPQVSELLDGLPPDDFSAFVETLACAAAAGRQDAVRAPDPQSLVCWVEQDASVHVRHPVIDVFLRALSGSCDSCAHPAADHDPQTGACVRVSPTFGPCPCERTPAPARAAQQQLHDRFRQGAQRGSVS